MIHGLIMKLTILNKEYKFCTNNYKIYILFFNDYVLIIYDLSYLYLY